MATAPDEASLSKAIRDLISSGMSRREAARQLAQQYGFTFVGGHPMAGTQFSGYKYSRADLFRGAAMVIVPPDFSDIALLSKVKELLAPRASAASM